jgi:hypothetical protein
MSEAKDRRVWISGDKCGLKKLKRAALMDRPLGSLV